MGRNPREVTWTVLYRRKHKKGQEEDVTKKRNKRTQKFQRAVVGATLQDIMAKGNQKPEVRKAQREQAVRAAKDAKKQTASKCPVWRQEGTEGSEGCRQECPEVRPQGWRKEINRHL